MSTQLELDSPRRSLAPFAAAMVSTLIVAFACWAWQQSSPSLGERPFNAARIWTVRSAAIALWAVAHALLFGVALPSFYRKRPIYLGLAGVLGFAATITAVTAAALYAAAIAGTSSVR